MVFRVSGKNLNIGDALRVHVEQRLHEVLQKYYGGHFNGHLTVEKEGYGFRVDCALHLDTGITLQSHGHAADAHAACDQAIDRVSKRLSRYKSRLKDHNAADAYNGAVLPATSYILEAPDEALEEAEVENYNPAVIAEVATNIKKLPVSSAVLELDMIGAPALVFRNAAHGRINVVYRRLDGNIGWIDPQLEKAAG